jgi:CDP-glucose 4,6-dehydratase
VESLVKESVDFSHFKDCRVFVTGHTGFKGAWLCFWLNQLGAKVYGYSLPPAYPGSVFERVDLGSTMDGEFSDVRDSVRLSAAMRAFEPEILFHLAAQPLVRAAYDDPKYTFDVNVGGAVNLLEAVRATPSLKSVVFVTSDKCYRNKEWVWGYRETDELGGKDPYSASKACAELVFSSYVDSFLAVRRDLGIATVRAGNVIGGGDWSPNRIVPDCLRALLSDQPIVLRSPHATRPWQHVLEPLGGYMRLALLLARDPGRFGGSWNFGPGSDSINTVLALVEKIVADWGKGQIRTEIDPNAPHESGLLQLSIDKARLELDWKPRWGFGQTVSETVAWYRRVEAGESAAAVTAGQIRTYESSVRA